MILDDQVPATMQQPRPADLTADAFIEWAMRQPAGRFELLRGEVVAMTPERVAQRVEMRRLLEGEIDSLPDEYRVVFVLRVVEELSEEETAGALGIPAATVRGRLFRARSLLRESLASKVDLACEEAFAFAGDRCDRIVLNVLERVR